MSRFLSKRFSELIPYTPGEQPRDQKYVKLNTNESPYPPSPGVLAAVNSEEVKKLNLYPDPTASTLTKKLAEFYGVEKKNVILSNGSDDILNFAFMAFCDKDNGAIFPEISYGFYEVFAHLDGIKFKKIPLKSDFTIHPTDYYNANAMVVIANPNAPTGLVLTVAEIEEIVRQNPNNVVLIDEAYVDFGAESAITLTKRYDNLLVVGTFSKSRSLAGARLGFAIGHEELISDLNTIKFSTNPYDINRLTQAAGIAALEDAEYYRECNKQTAEIREYTKAELKKRGFQMTDSKANFIFVRSDKIKGWDYYFSLKNEGVLVRHFSSDKTKDYVRITIGTKEQMDTLLRATDKILGEV
ncbi:MAG: histidinol-phosphate transaminase [Clostridia bacterium]|nr:histidinol-phosphate transaminase [Clostridia bacterium]